MSHALPLFCADAVRAIERAAFARGVDAFGLMTRAGEAAAALLRERCPQVRRVGVLCGAGNNGGDGYVAALALYRAGLHVEVVAIGEPRTPEARAAASRWHEAGQGVRAASTALPDVDAWVDGLLGIGLTRAPEAPLADLLEAVALQHRPVLALDVPSGLDADRGSAPGACLPASITLCFVAAKPGLFTAQGREISGEVQIEPLGLDVPALAVEAAMGPPSAWAVRASLLAKALPRRRVDSHKGHHGRVVCLGGEHGMAGALVLCAEAAARGGAGWVEALTRPETVVALNVRRPEVMAGILPAADALASRLAAADVLAVGPGLGQGEWGRGVFDVALASGRPLVLDADALNLLAEAPRAVSGAVLTPHPGEAARLLGCRTAEVQADRFAAASALVSRFGAAVVLKGAGTVVAAPGETPRLIDAGHSGMASAGMGDALTGLVAALRAQGLPAFEAAWVGALGHAAAADVVARGRGLLASDVVEAFRSVLNP